MAYLDSSITMHVCLACEPRGGSTSASAMYVCMTDDCMITYVGIQLFQISHGRVPSKSHLRQVPRAFLQHVVAACGAQLTEQSVREFSTTTEALKTPYQYGTSEPRPLTSMTYPNQQTIDKKKLDQQVAWIARRQLTDSADRSGLTSELGLRRFVRARSQEGPTSTTQTRA